MGVNITQLVLESSDRSALTHVRNHSTRSVRSIAQLRSNVAALSAAFKRLGVNVGDIVLVVGGSRVELAESLLAAMNCGAVGLPVSPLLGPSHLVSITTSMRPRFCVHEEDLDPLFRSALDSVGAIRVSLRSQGGSEYTYDALAHQPAPPADYPDFPDEQLALVVYGSGSSGNLKAVTMTHGALLRFLEYSQFVYSQYSDGPNTLQVTGPMIVGIPLVHLAGLGTCLLGLMSGRQTYLMNYFLAKTYLQLLEESRCHHMLLVPSLYGALLREPYLKLADLSALRFCITGGEACPSDLCEQIESAFGVPVVTAYSMTECLSGIGHSRADLFARSVPRGSCGKQLFGELSLRDADGAEQTEIGELWIRNSTVRDCYLDKSMLASRLVNGWFRTGDLFRRDSGGNFFHLGRVDDMFICNGKNIYPAEIELLLLKHPDVEATCVAPVRHKTKGTIPAALAVLRGPASASGIQEFVMKFGSSHIVPQIIVFTTALPLLGPGKIDRLAIQHILQERHDQHGSS